MDVTQQATVGPGLNLALREFKRKRSINFLDWMRRDGRRHTGEYLDPGEFPHIYAKGGPAEAFSDPRYEEFALKWSTRGGKTTLCQQYLLYHQAESPVDCLFSTATEKLATRNRDKRFSPISKHTPSVNLIGQSGYRLDYESSSIYLAWSGSTSMLGDMSAKIVVRSEVDKWTKATSDEADPMKLAAQRAKEYRDRQILTEGTPTLLGRSRIDSIWERSTKHRFHVPCPHCRSYQVLRFGTVLDQGDPRAYGGVVWDKPEGEEHSTPDYARKTARYCCEHCHEEIFDHHRPQMMRAGAWAAEGQTVDRDGVVFGDVPDRQVYGCHWSSLCSLAMNWGDFAYRFLVALVEDELQDFINSDLGEVYSEVFSPVTVDDVRLRLLLPYKLATVPDGMEFLTAGIDLQGNRWVWVVMAWGVSPFGRLINYGETESDEELIRLAVAETYYHVSGRPFRIRAAGLDSGFLHDYVYQVADSNRIQNNLPTYPIKGGHIMGGKTYNISDRAVKRGRRPGRRIQEPLVMVNTNHWQSWIQRALEKLGPDDVGGLGFPEEMKGDDDFFSQLLNEGKSSKVNKQNYLVEEWIKVDPNAPNDFRDCVRYARVMAQLFKRGKWQRHTQSPQVPAAAARIEVELKKEIERMKGVESLAQTEKTPRVPVRV